MNKIRKQWEYMLIGTPAAMLSFFMLSTSAYIFNYASYNFVLASPFLGGGLSFAAFFYSQLNKLNSSKKTKVYSNEFNSIFTYHSNEFIFWSRNLRTPITEDKFFDFCKIGCYRQKSYFEKNKLFQNKNNFSNLSKNQIWSEYIFIERNKFLSEEVWSCKKILELTGQFYGWRQGAAGMAICDKPETLLEVSKRRWEIIKHPQTSNNISKPGLVAKKLINVSNYLTRI